MEVLLLEAIASQHEISRCQVYFWKRSCIALMNLSQMFMLKIDNIIVMSFTQPQFMREMLLWKAGARLPEGAAVPYVQLAA